MTVDDFEWIGGALCLDFANTVRGRGLPREQDLLGSYADLLSWSRIAGSLPEEDLQAIDDAPMPEERAAVVIRRARSVRDTTLRLFTGVPAMPPARALVDRLNRELRACLPHRTVDLFSGTARWRWRVQSLPEALLWPVVWSASELLTSEEAGRVKQCQHETCAWLFLDRSKNRSRRWCVPEVCGNRARVGRYYRRAREASG